MTGLGCNNKDVSEEGWWGLWGKVGLSGNILVK